MEKLIKVSRINIIILLFFACGSVNKKVNENNYIYFSSILEKDSCTLSIDDVLYFKNKIITTDRSLGIDTKNHFYFNSENNEIHFKVEFEGDFVEDVDLENDIRKISLDTIINLKKGKFLMVNARIDNIEIIQSKKKFTLD